MQVAAFLHCFETYLRNTPPSSLTGQNAVNDGSFSSDSYPDALPAKISPDSANCYNQHNLALVRSNPLSTELLSKPTGSTLSTMARNNHDEPYNRSNSGQGGDPRRRYTDFERSWAQERVQDPRFNPGQTFYDTDVAGSAVLGNVIDSSRPQEYRNNFYARTRVLESGFAVLGDVQSATFEGMHRRQTTTAVAEDPYYDPPSRRSIQRSERTTSMPLSLDTNERRRQARDAAEARRMNNRTADSRDTEDTSADTRRTLNNGRATATFVSTPLATETEERPRQRSSFARYGRGYSLQQTDNADSRDTRR